VATDRDARAPWIASRFDEDTAVRGLHSVTLVVRDPKPTIDLMTDLLGCRVLGESGRRIRMAVGGDRPGHVIDVAHDASAPPMVNGLGTVHHVAMAVESDAEQLRLREAVVARGLKVTEVRDRCYFKSIYFREPGGVLFELATMQPGFSVDEPVADLGRGLKLPPWEEPHRRDIEARLAPIKY
jgi:glyoxalase family protein